MRLFALGVGLGLVLPPLATAASRLLARWRGRRQSADAVRMTRERLQMLCGDERRGPCE